MKCLFLGGTLHMRMMDVGETPPAEMFAPADLRPDANAFEAAAEGGDRVTVTECYYEYRYKGLDGNDVTAYLFKHVQPRSAEHLYQGMMVRRALLELQERERRMNEDAGVCHGRVSV